jgi:H/ACA ribonucleoprotein complex subunit 4
MKDIKKLLNFGLINIDKPSGPTSFTVSESVKKRLGLSKTSHMGTLDPKVTGVLPVTLGRACRLADYFIRHDKAYIGVLHTHVPQKIGELQKLIDENFSGKIIQMPPHKSAVKRAERVREIYKFEFLEVGNEDGDAAGEKEGEGEEDGTGKDFLFYCEVEGGTYIRKICSDLGDMIGGAHMAELRRTSAGIFDEETLVDLNEFKMAVEDWKMRGNDKRLREMIVPAEKAIGKVLPVVEVEKRAVKALYVGKPLFVRDIVDSEKVGEELKEGDSFALFSGRIFVGVYFKTSTKGKAVFGKAVFVYN